MARIAAIGTGVMKLDRDMVRDAGIEMRELTTVAQMMTRGDFQAFLIGWSGRVDPDGDIFAFNHCRGANNDSKFYDPRVDAALAVALPARHRICLAHEAWRFAHTGRLSDFRALPDGIMRMEGIRLD